MYIISTITKAHYNIHKTKINEEMKKQKTQIQLQSCRNNDNWICAQYYVWQQNIFSFLLYSMHIKWTENCFSFSFRFVFNLLKSFAFSIRNGYHIHCRCDWLVKRLKEFNSISFTDDFIPFSTRLPCKNWSRTKK